MLPKTQATYRQNNEYFGALDGFRGVLALMVAIHHSTWFSYTNYRSFINEGFVILDLFFAFSGFLMYRLYRDNLGGTAQARGFIKRRFARLYPLHFFMIMVFLGFALVRLWAHKFGFATVEPGEILPFTAGAQESLPSLISNLTLTHSMGLHESLSFNYPSWTISVEFFVYFVFTAMMIWAAPRRAWHFGLIAVIVGLIYAGLSRVKPDMNVTYDLGFFRCLGGFFTGVVTAWIYGQIKDGGSTALSRGLMTGIECIVLTLSVCFVIYCTGMRQFFVAPILALFVLVFAFDRGHISQFMSLPVFRYLAKISYSVYMVHVIIAIGFAVIGQRLMPDHITVGPDGSGWIGDAYLIPYLAVVILCSHLTWRYVEVPGGRWLRRLRVSKIAKPKSAPA